MNEFLGFALCVVACACAVLFDQYDFNSTKSISKDEMVMLHSSLISGCCKLDSRVCVRVC